MTAEFEADAVIAGVETIADDVVLLTLTGPGLPAWTPGSHLDLVLGDGLVRQYSLCGSPEDSGRYQVAVLHAPDSRGGSRTVHALQAGTSLAIRGPRNHFELRPSARYLFIAGGIGITPIIPMIAQAEAEGAEWELHYGGRTTQSMAFRDLLGKYGDRVHLVPQDEAGLLDLPTILATPTPETLVYCCGPEPLLQAVLTQSSHWPAGSVRFERFAGVEQTGEDSAFEVVLERSGLTVTVQPGVTVFDTMRAAGVNVLGSCLEGICGTCEQAVLEGEVDHRDSLLDEDERAANDCMMVCVSRARSPRLVLDA